MTAIAQDGIPRRAIVRAPIIAVSAKTLVAMLDLAGNSPLEAMQQQPGFPAPIYPTGSSTPRWLVREVRTWLATSATRVSAGRKKYRPRKNRAGASTTTLVETECRPEPAEVIQ